MGDPTDVIQHRGSSIDPVRQTGPHAHSVTLDDTGHYAFVPDLGPDKLMIYRFDPNRGHESIVIYSIDQTDGMLSCIGHKSTEGKTPRHFIVDPDGEFLLAANQDTDSVITFRLDSASGALNATGHNINVPTPVCVRIL